MFEELLIADNKILKELDSVGKDRHKILDNFAKRVTLDAKKSVIMSDMGLLSTQYDIQSDIAKVISRIDALEGKISRSQDRKSSK